MKIILSGLVALLFSTASIFAQQFPPLNSGELLRQGVKFHEEEKYKEAVEVYRKIGRNDTNYSKALYEMAYSQWYAEQYDEAVNTIRQGLALDDWSNELEFMTLLGNVIDDKGASKQALTIYDSALARYPRAQSLLFNKAVCLMRLGEESRAEEMYKELLMVNPYYASVHFRLGNIALQRGQLVPALMSFYTYLLVNPEGNYTNAIIKLMSNISKGTEDVMEVVAKNPGYTSGNFAMVEKIILSKIALNEAYKPLTSLDDPILRQLQVMMEKLEYDSDDDDFFMQFYVPTLKAIFDNKLFEPASYRAFSSVTVDKIQKYLKGNQKQVNQAIEVITSTFNTINNTRVLNYNKRVNAEVIYHYQNNAVYAKGKVENNQVHGPWEFYFSNGNLRSKGEFRNGNKEGKWYYYYSNGVLNSTDNWKNGEMHGEDLIYNSDGILTNKAVYKNGKLQGDKIVYFSIGHINYSSGYKDGKESGKYIQYHSNGRKQIEAETLNDELEGKFLSFHENGKPNVVATYSEGKLHGLYETYYDNGQKEFSLNYKNGKAEGEALTWHPNGKLKRKIQYVNDEISGDELQYNSEGTLIEKTPYKNGKADGIAEFYASDGKLFSTYEFNKNKLMEAKYFDKTGKQISSSNRHRKEVAMDFYDEYGFKTSSVTYNDAAEKQGKEYFYYPSGKIKEENNYVDGQLEGLTKGYWPNGKLEYEISYSEGKKNGLSKNYYIDGKLKSQAWYVDDELNGDLAEYNIKGNLSSLGSYINGKIQGIRQIYYNTGKLEYEEHFKNQYFIGLKQFDTSGRVLIFSPLKNSNGQYKTLFHSKKTAFEGSYKNGEPHGSFTTYYFDGSISNRKSYDMGLLDGSYVDYHFGGQINKTGRYDLGKMTGEWKYYNDKGKLTRKELYKNGELDGIVTYYYPDGKTEREISYMNGERHGTYKRFGQDGQLSFQINYNYGKFISYTYEGKDGKLLPAIALPGETGMIKSFYRNGNPSAVLEVADGYFTGAYKLYFPNGKIYYQETESLFNLTHGMVKQFYSDGKPEFEYVYYYDHMEGPYKEYHANGNLREEGVMYGGLYHGTRKLYNEAGKLVKTLHYYDGTILNAE